jgi:SAM-dependent methyltransferase
MMGGQPMESKAHWENVYQTKAPDKVSWYAPHLDTSVKLIQRAAPQLNARIIDVGGGESTLVDDLVRAGYNQVSVLDISSTAIAFARRRIGELHDRVAWYCADITAATLPESYFDVWHDRAVFHFLTTDQARAAYLRNMAHSVKHGGHVIISTFGPEGPDQCSGLDVVKYDADSLHGAFGKSFQLIESSTELHHTPFGTTQQFLYCFCRMQ